MANPNLVSNTSSVLDIMVESQLGSGNNDFTVPNGTSWTLKSLSVCNVSGSSVTLNASVIKAGAGGARKIVHNQTIGPGDTLIVGQDALAVLPEGAVLRLNSSAATSLDALATGLVST